MQHVSAHSESAQNLEMSLREHLLAAGAPDSQQHSPYPPPPATSNAGPTADNPYQGSNSGSPHDHHLDPNMGGHAIPYSMNNQHSDNDPMQSTPKGKRELSTSKRAAQNRAAQRAFRQRKEGYIKKLEEQVKDFEQMEQNYRRLQNENYQLREYILNLQSRLLETKGDIPAAPAEMHLPGRDVSNRMRGESVESGVSEDQDDGGASRLQAAAAQAEARAQDAPMYNMRDRDDEKASATDAPTTS